MNAWGSQPRLLAGSGVYLPAEDQVRQRNDTGPGWVWFQATEAPTNAGRFTRFPMGQRLG